MQRMSGLDPVFLGAETDTVPMHVGALLVFDARGVPGFGFEAVREALARRLHVMPALRRRPVEAPLKLIHPFWVEDPEFRIERHFKRATLPAPGTRAQLEALVGRLFAPRLPRDRPLWEIHYIDGLASGEVALLWKMHHACLDGVLGAEMFSRALDPAPDAPPPPVPAWTPEPLPGRLRLAWRSVRAAAGVPQRAIALARETAPALAGMLARSASPARESGDAPRPRSVPLFGPRTCFNTMITGERSCAFGTLSMEAINRVRAAYGVTVNDVVLAACGEGVRRYLLKYAELPGRPLIAAVPLSLRSKDDTSTTNRVTIGRVSLATDLEDPVQRLQALSARMNRVKRFRKTLPGKVLMDWIDVPMPALVESAARLNESLRAMAHLQMPFNIVVSNIPGPQRPLYIAGARLQALYPLSIVYHGLGANITMMSYCDRVNLGITAHPRTVPHVEYLMRSIEDGLGELVKACDVAEKKLVPAAGIEPATT